MNFTNIVAFFTFYLAFMVTCIVLNNQENYIWFDIIRDETTEWGLGAITDVVAVPVSSPSQMPECPTGYDQKLGMFLGTLGKCVRKSGLVTVS